MSQYRTSTTTLDPDVVALGRLLGDEHAALLSGACSVDAHALAAEVRLLPPADGWAALTAALPGWEALPAASVDALRSARAVAGPLDAALEVVARDLGALERTAVAALAGEALIELGYGIESASDPTTAAIEARRGHEVLLVAVGAGGTITTDHAGLVGDACGARQSDFVAAMARCGVRLDERATTRHDDPRGGSLLQAAARAGRANLALGAVAARSAAPVPARRRTVDAGGAR